MRRCAVCPACLADAADRCASAAPGNGGPSPHDSSNCRGLVPVSVVKPALAFLLSLLHARSSPYSQEGPGEKRPSGMQDMENPGVTSTSRGFHKDRGRYQPVQMSWRPNLSSASDTTWPFTRQRPRAWPMLPRILVSSASMMSVSPGTTGRRNLILSALMK